jgi:hypothetical protein
MMVMTVVMVVMRAWSISVVVVVRARCVKVVAIARCGRRNQKQCQQHCHCHIHGIHGVSSAREDRSHSLPLSLALSLLCAVLTPGIAYIYSH